VNVLIVVAHPDDEVLGCGGTIAKHAHAGDTIRVVILAEGVTSRGSSRDTKRDAGRLTQLARAAKKAGKVLGVSDVVLHNFPDNRMDTCDLLDVIKVVEKQVADVMPDVIYTHHAGDLNIDHQITQRAVVTACRPVPDQCVRQLLFMEVSSSSEWQPPSAGIPFTPNWHVDITSTLELKLSALEAYRSEMRDWPHTRSMEALEALARWRGATVGVEAAEAFMLGRMVQRIFD
jgi:LmbE family N-acetylglucosaminyl deacetylase